MSLKGFNRTQGDMAGTGLLVEDAGYAARRAFGNTTLVKEEVCEMWGWRSLERLKQDLGYAARTLKKSPGFTYEIAGSLCPGPAVDAGYTGLPEAQEEP